MSSDFRPMLANAIAYEDIPKRVSKWNAAILDPKVDGIRCTVHTGSPSTSVELYSRTGHRLTEKVPKKLLKQLSHLPFNLIIDGELGVLEKVVDVAGHLWPIIDFNATTRITGSGEDVAQDKLAQLDKPFQFWAFDILDPFGPIPKQADRSNNLRRLFHDYVSPNWDVKRIPFYYFNEWDWWAKSAYTEYVEAGGEGVMIKNADAIYQPDSRLQNIWYKLKKFETIDVRITGFLDGQGKYKDMIGAVKFVDENGVEGKCSGMTDLERQNFTNWKEVFIGHVMEIRHFGRLAKGGDGGYRFPQFIRMRPDKD